MKEWMMTLHWFSRHKKRLIMLAVTVGITASMLFAYRQWKTQVLKTTIETGARWVGKCVIEPNHLSVSHIGGGGYDWFGIGPRCNLNVLTTDSEGRELTFFVYIKSDLFSTEITDVLMACQGLDLPEDSEALAGIIIKGAPRSRPISLDEAKSLDRKQLAEIAASDAMQIVRMSIPGDMVNDFKPLLLSEAFPALFGNPKNRSSAEESMQTTPDNVSEK
jgi:hypothetical protein